MTMLAANKTSIIIDTLKLFNTLTDAGFTKSQADAAKTDLSRMEDKVLARLDRVEERINTTTHNVVFWFTAALFAQGAMVVSLIQLLR